MALYFDKITLLQYEHRPISFDAGLRFKIEKKFSITGVLREIFNERGVESLVNKEKLALNAIDYEEIFLNSISFGKGKIVDVDFGGGNLVKSENVVYSIICYEDGNLENASSGVYSGINWSKIKYITKLDEKFSFSTDSSNNQKYSHTVNIQIDNSVGTDSLTIGDTKISLAQVIASNLFNSVSGIGQFLGNYSDPLSLRRVYSESYNLIDCSCSFSESVEIPAARSLNYSLSLKYDVKLDPQGFVSVSETGKITSLVNPLYPTAIAAFIFVKEGAFLRSNAIYNSYNYSSAALFFSPISESVTINKFNGEIDFTFNYSNNPKYHALATWEHEILVDVNNDGYYQIIENGTIRGIGRPYVDKLPNAKTFYNEISNEIASRAMAAYNNTINRNLPLILSTQSISYSEAEGSVIYSRAYTDNNLFILNSAIRKSEIDITKSSPTVITQQFPTLNVGTLLQYQDANTRGQTSVQIKLRGTRKTTMGDYLSYAKNLARPYYVGDDIFIKSCRYSLNITENEFSFNTDFEYTDAAKNFGDLTIT